MNLDQACRRLRLCYIRDNLNDYIQEAITQGKSYEQFLNDLLCAEVELRDKNAIQRRIREARFPNRMLLADFRRDHLDPSIQKVIETLSSLDFISRKENVLMVGNPGVGKTALACALGMEACLKGKSVLFIRVSDLLIELREAMSKERILRYKKKFISYDVVILDELGYCQFDRQAGEILFNLITSRTEKGTVILTSNLLPEQWNQVFKDEVMTGAVTDRLMHHCYALDMTGESYRVIETRQWLERQKA